MDARIWPVADSLNCYTDETIMDEDDLIEEYSQLKLEVITKAEMCPSFSLEQMKNFYSKNINSQRSLSKVNSPNHVLELLEERNLLNSKMVGPLHYLGELLCNAAIKELVRGYRKLYLDGIDETLCTCGLLFPYTPTTLPLTEHVGNSDSFLNIGNNSNSVDSLSEAIENVCLSIGNEWAVLARELGVREFQIEQAYAKYPSDVCAQARLSLVVWRRTNENASIELLDKGLEARHCKRKGIGSFLRSHVVGLTC